MTVLTEPSHPLFLRCARALGALSTCPVPPQDLLGGILHALEQLPGSFSPRQASVVAACLASGMLRLDALSVHHMRGAERFKLRIWDRLVVDKAALRGLLHHGVCSPESSQRLRAEEVGEEGGWLGLLQPPSFLPSNKKAAAEKFWQTPRMTCLEVLSASTAVHTDAMRDCLPAEGRFLSEEMLDWLVAGLVECRTGMSAATPLDGTASW